MDEVVAKIRAETVGSALMINADLASEEDRELLKKRQEDLQHMRNLLNYYTANYSCGLSGASHEQTASGQGA